ncbi:VanZ family protein [Pleionea mediterranea]|jgi:VanZ family protein|uniref:VanZ like protein n=1 Tax=Pleionea mediterranea TaxID=523701 RepID=A0A316GFI6_9GAMM|nr:VanZ family protein [Pleionea mediterranea]PWK53457.1 VanZ like protein [Pleionea mediterranea]
MSLSQIKHWLPKAGHPFWKVLAFSSVIFLLLLTLGPSLVKGGSIKHLDKVFHFIAFAGVTYVLLAAYSKIKTLYVILTLSLLGAAIEIAQYYIPGRSFSLLDLVADVLGVIAAVYLFQKIHPDTE